MKDTRDLSVLFLTTARGSTMMSKKAHEKEVLQRGQVSQHQNAGSWAVGASKGQSAQRKREDLYLRGREAQT